MHENKRYKGIWFLPGIPEIEIAGELIYKPGKTLCLELIGDLKNRTEFYEYFSDENSIHSIHGITTEGLKISLFHCSGSWSVKTYSVPVTKYAARAYMIGKHMLEHEEQHFDLIEVDFPQLLGWLGKNAFVQTREEVNPSFFRNTITYSPDEGFNARYQIENGFQLELNLTATGITKRENSTIKNLPSVRITHKTELSAWDLVRRMNVFRSFLSLGLLQAVPFTFIKLREKATGEMIDYIFLEHDEVYDLKEKAFLYNFHRIEHRLPELLKAWYNNTKDMFPIRMHLLNAILPKQSFHSTDFLVLAFALEGFYHRFLKITGGNKGNLTSALSNVQKIFKDLTFIKKISVKPDEVNDSRNYYAHLYEKEPGKQILTGIELLKLSEKLKVLLVLSMLKNMGFEINEIEKCVAHSDLLSAVNSF